MTHEIGADIGGIRAMTDILDRCHVDELTGCWLWRGGLSDGRYPSVWMADLRIRTTIGVAIATLTTGRRPERGVIWHSTCGDATCCRPDHRKPGTRSSQMLAAGVKRSAATIAKTARTKQAASKVCDHAKADRIRSSDKLLREIAAEEGVSISTAHSIRTGKRWRKSLPASSVFSWGSR